MIKYLKSCVFFLILSIGGLFLSAYEPSPPKIISSKLTLTVQQQAWIKAHPVINIGFDGNFPPYSVFTENGQWQGYAVDVFSLITKKTGLTFKPSALHQWSWIYQAGKQRDLDVIATMVDRPERHEWFSFTSPYIFKSLVIVTNKDQSLDISRQNLANKTIALVKDYQYVARVLTQFPSVTPYYVSNIEQALELVSAGKVDAAIGFLSAVHYYKEKLLLTNIEVSSFFDRQSANESMAVRSDWPMLQQILQQALVSINSVEKEQLAHRWLPKEQIEQKYNNAIKLAFLLTLLVLILLWAVWLFNRKNRTIAKAKLKTEQAITELELLKNSLEHQVIERTKKLLVLSYQDKITGLDNRNAFYEKGKQLFKNHIQQQQPMVLLVINVDRFKNINDNFGHQVGNDVLKKIAKRLSEFTSSNDLLVRYGGDEFGILLSNISAEQALIVAKQLLARLQQPYLVARKPFSLSFSIGLAQIPEDAATLELLYQHAELAMFNAKEQQTGVVQYQVSESTEISNYIQLEQNLLKAIRLVQHHQQQSEFSLRFQPIKYINKSGLNSFEVLIRWQHQQLGFIAPDVFIPLAEQLNKIKHIGHWVRISALKQAKIWHQQGVAFNRLSLNISAVELQQADFVTQLKTEVMSQQADFNWIELEVTETAILKDPEHAISMLNQCRALGMTISIDDFGTGYSSLVYLKRIPADVVKIDREFVKNLPESIEDASIDQTIVQLCHNFNKLVVAEGVETFEQYQMLKSFGVDCIQGYIVAKPLTAEQISQDLPFFALTTDDLLQPIES